jgi:hypothetical protein
MTTRHTQYNVEIQFWDLTIDLLTNIRQVDRTELGQHIAAVIAWAAIGFLIGILIGSARLLLGI